MSGVEFEARCRSRLVEYRKAEGLTQAQLAGRMGWRQGRVSALELGRESSLRLSTVHRLAVAFGVEARDLLAFIAE